MGRRHGRSHGTEQGRVTDSIARHGAGNIHSKPRGAPAPVHPARRVQAKAERGAGGGTLYPALWVMALWLGTWIAMDRRLPDLCAVWTCAELSTRVGL